jgi:hypothetical protein
MTTTAGQTTREERDSLHGISMVVRCALSKAVGATVVWLEPWPRICEAHGVCSLSSEYSAHRESKMSLVYILLVIILIVILLQFLF